MTVDEVWGRIQGHDAALISQAGDVWLFIVPAWVTGPVIVEFWAKDDVGNISYRSGIFSIEEGTKKCIIKWLDDHGICKMIAHTRGVEMLEVRPRITMERHTCIKMEA